jgi:glutamate synthase (NADPH/NADH) large chain
MSPEKRAFYEYHASLIEPWDGPAALMFTDGALIGAPLDRNGLRPAKYVVTGSGMVVMASELGVLDIDAADVVAKGRLQPGKMFLVDPQTGRLVPDAEIKGGSRRRALRQVGRRQDRSSLDDVEPLPSRTGSRSLAVFGYTDEDLKIILGPMAAFGEEPVGSMGIDIPWPSCRKAQLLFRYFKQHFAQVLTPVDPLRGDHDVKSAASEGGISSRNAATMHADCRTVSDAETIYRSCAKISSRFPGIDPIHAFPVEGTRDATSRRPRQALPRGGRPSPTAPTFSS